MKKILFFALTLLLCLTLVGCGKNEDKTTDLVKDKDWKTAGKIIEDYLKDDSKKVSEVKMTFEFPDEDGIYYLGYMRFVLFRDLAPVTVDNFVKLSNKHFYDNLTITRVNKDTLCQGGDPEKKTTKEEKETINTIKGEFEENEVYNNLMHTRGVISMARASEYDSASSQFFVVNNDFSSGDGSYAAFGVLLEEKDPTTGSSLTKEQRNYTIIDGKKVLYDYDCLDKLCNLVLENDTIDGAPVDTISIVKIEVLQENVKMSDIK